MNSKKAFEMINELYEKKENSYYVDFVPITFLNEDFAELAEYLEVNYKPEFAKKIIFIAFTILYYYDSYVFLDNALPESQYPGLINSDLRHLGLDKLASLIKKIIIENWSEINILFEHDNQISLMCIKDEYDTYFCNLSGDALKMIDQLVNHQGLFLKKADYTNEDD